jgi:hypothetical protein
LRHQFEQEKNQLEQLKAQLQQNQTSTSQVENTLQLWLNAHPDFHKSDLDALAQINSAQEQHIRQKLTAPHKNQPPMHDHFHVFASPNLRLFSTSLASNPALFQFVGQYN